VASAGYVIHVEYLNIEYILILLIVKLASFFKVNHRSGISTRVVAALAPGDGFTNPKIRVDDDDRRKNKAARGGGDSHEGKVG